MVEVATHAEVVLVAELQYEHPLSSGHRRISFLIKSVNTQNSNSHYIGY